MATSSRSAWPGGNPSPLKTSETQTFLLDGLFLSASAHSVELCLCVHGASPVTAGAFLPKKAPLALEMRYFQRSTYSAETLWRQLCACGQSQQQLTEMRARAAGGAAAGPRMVGSLRLQGLGPFCEAACHHWPHHLRMSCRHIP